MEENKKERNVGLDLLRIISMVMVIVLHYLGKGGLLDSQNTDQISNTIYWLMESLSIVAVNCYILISGYFLIKSEFKWKKFFKIWGEVIFYSVIIYIIIISIGLVKFNIMDAIRSFMPIITNQYWFVTAYLCLYLLSPFINKLLLNLTKKEFIKLLIILIIIFSVITILPSEMLLDKTGGYGIIWFICLYCVAAYIRLYINIDEKNKKYLGLYFLLATIITGIIIAIKYICTKVGISDKSGKMLQYDNILIFIESVCLFLYFRNIKINNINLIKIVNRIAPLTFAVYIIHEQFILRTILYNKILFTQNCYHNLYGILIVIFSVIAIFITCILIEYIRQKIERVFLNHIEKVKKQDM